MEVRARFFRPDREGNPIVNLELRVGDHSISVLGVRVVGGYVLLPGLKGRSGFFRVVYLSRELMEAVVKAVEACLGAEAGALKPVEEQVRINEPAGMVRQWLEGCE